MMPVLRTHSSANVERVEFAKKLINLMRDNNMNQADLARKAGLTRDAVSTYVRARSMPEPINLAKLAKALNVEPSFFQLDAFRVAGRMQSGEIFDARAQVAEAFSQTGGKENQISMTVDSDGQAIVRINAKMDVAKAAELLAFFKKD
jgi:transcriptional regulator with XRE-family HTH domain